MRKKKRPVIARCLLSADSPQHTVFSFLRNNEEEHIPVVIRKKWVGLKGTFRERMFHDLLCSVLEYARNFSLIPEYPFFPDVNTRHTMRWSMAL